MHRRGAVAVAALNAPPRNVMTFAGMTALERHIESLAADGSVAALVIGSDVPGWFIAHGDLEDLVALGRGEPFDGDAASWPRTAELVAQMPQIVVAAIDGQAGGGGCEFALCCDLRVAGPSARFSFPEIGLGMIPGGGGTQRLPRLIGPGRAAELILTGRAMEAEEAARVGLVDAVLADEPFLEAAIEWTARLALQPRNALIAAKRALRAAAELPLGEGLAREAELVAPLLSQPETIALEQAAIARCRGDGG
ncbi:MAG TPA: enoyl-CoA hydratase/isomerase family protein [Solirubrobacteraceae bacterium]|nr:enoyl-CoA hydratase/isomerase family protein [Solirubrobacteraceae bacterium]